MLKIEGWKEKPEVKLIQINHAPNYQQPITDIRWLKVQDFLRSNSFSNNSRRSYSSWLHRFLEWTDLGFQELKPRHLANYKEYLKTEVRTTSNNNLSKSSVNLAIAALKSFFKWMVLTYPEIMPTNPIAGVKLEKIPLPPAQSLTQEQMQQVWDAVEQMGNTKQRDTALIHILAHGLRASELVGLNVGDFDGKLIYLADTKNDEPRIVPLRQESQQAVQNYLEWRKQEGEDINNSSPLILSCHPSYYDQRLSYHGVYYAVERIGHVAGMDWLHPHSFRHTFATKLLLLGVDPAHARKLVGIRSEKTFKRYTLAGEQQAAVSAFYRAIGEE